MYILCPPVQCFHWIPERVNERVSKSCNFFWAVALLLVYLVQLQSDNVLFILSYFILLDIKKMKNLATIIKVNNCTVIPAMRGNLSFLRQSDTGYINHFEQDLCSGVVGQHIMDFMVSLSDLFSHSLASILEDERWGFIVLSQGILMYCLFVYYFFVFDYFCVVLLVLT